MKKRKAGKGWESKEDEGEESKDGDRRRVRMVIEGE